MVEEDKAAAAPTDATAAPPTGFGADVAADAAATEEPGAAAAGEGEVKAPEETWETIFERIQANEALKPAYEAHLEEVRQEARKQGLSDAQSRLQPMLQRYMQAAQAATQGIADVRKVIEKAAEDGGLDSDTLKAALDSHNQWVGLLSLTHAQGTYDGAKALIHLLAQELDNKELGQSFAARIDAVLSGADTDKAIAADLLDAIIADRKEKAIAPLKAKIALLEAQLEKAKAQARQGQGPDLTSTGAQGVGALSEEAISRMSAEEYERRRPEILRWQAQKLRGG